MSMLNFKYGLYSGLYNENGTINTATAPLKEGTVYITTDEQAMYVDLRTDKNKANSVSRIRLSQIITLNTTAEWQQLEPPYSTTAFYYIAQANALIKYTGNGTDHSWRQINSTKDLQDTFDGLGFLGVLSEKPSTTGAKKGQICTVLSNGSTKNYIYDGTKWVECGTIGSEILDLNDEVSSVSGVASGAMSSINAMKEGASTTTFKGIEDKISKLTTTDISGMDKYATVDQLNTAKSNILGEGTDGADFDGTVQGAYEAAASVSTALSTHKTDNNPHNISKTTIGLGNVENTSDMNKPVSTAQQAAIATAKSDILGEGDNGADYVGTVKGAYEAAASVSTALSTHKTDDNPHGITAGTIGLDKVENKNVSDIKEELSTNNTIADSASNTGFTTGKDVYDAIKAAKIEITGGSSSSISGLAQALENHKKDNNPHGITASLLGVGAFENKDFDDIKEAFETNNTIADSASNTGFTTGKDVYDAIKAAKESVQGSNTSETITSVNTKAEQNATAISNLSSTVTSSLRAADAMTFKGTINVASGTGNKLPTNKVENGWTYKVTANILKADFTDASVTIDSLTTNDDYIRIGDLLIASGSETNGVITGTIKWVHVPSGYMADYNPKFTLSEANATGDDLGNNKKADSDNSVTINLTSGASTAEGDLGKIIFSADSSSAIRIVANNTNDNSGNLTLSLAWDTF